MLGLLSYIVCMCYIDDRIFLFAQICQGSDSSVYLFVCFLAILSPIHFFSKCSPYLDGLVEHPPGFPHSFLRITTALTQVSNEIHLGEFPHQLAHTVHLCAMLVQTQDSLLLQPASFMQGLCELTLLKIWGNSVRSTLQKYKKLQVKYQISTLFKVPEGHSITGNSPLGYITPCITVAQLCFTVLSFHLYPTSSLPVAPHTFLIPFYRIIWLSLSLSQNTVSGPSLLILNYQDAQQNKNTKFKIHNRKMCSLLSKYFIHVN